MTQSELRRERAPIDLRTVAPAMRSSEIRGEVPGEQLRAIEASRVLANARDGCFRGARYALVMQAAAAAIISALIYAKSHF